MTARPCVRWAALVLAGAAFFGLACSLAFPLDKYGSLPVTVGPEGGMGCPDGAASRNDWCSLQDAGYRICSDFDQPSGVTQGFDLGILHPFLPNGGTFAIDMSTFVSCPQSATGTAAPSAPGGSTGAQLVATMWSGAAPSTFACDFELQLRTQSNVGGDGVDIGGFQFFDSSRTGELGEVVIGMSANGNVNAFENLGPGTAHGVPISLATGRWYLAHMSFSTAGAVTSYDIRVGGVSAEGSSLAAAIPSPSTAVFFVGPVDYNTPGSSGWAFSYDNVVCY